jgi:putative endonuclease
MSDDRFWVYILASKPHGVLYLGVTNDLERRVWEHRARVAAGFTTRYNVHRLVWMAGFPTAEEAIVTEKRMKKWRRAWKIRTIEAVNPSWEDLMPGEAVR